MVGSTYISSNVFGVVDDNSNPYRNIIMDAMRINKGYAGECSIIDEEPNDNAIEVFDLLKDSNEPLWDGYTNHNKLSVVAQVFTIKSDHELSKVGYNKIIELTSILPERNKGLLSLEYQKIDTCPNFYMLYYLRNTTLIECRLCEHAHYKPRIAR
jgi:hypothetical protein